MESLKAVVGLGQKEQQGQEPVSGVKGSGSAAELAPYDAGNDGEISKLVPRLQHER